MCNTRGNDSRTRRTPRLDERGVTLIEVMVAGSVFVLGMAGLLQTHLIAAGSDGRARRTDRAVTVAQDLLTWLQTVPYDHDLLVPAEDTNGGDLLDQTKNFNRRQLDPGWFDYSEADITAIEGSNPCAAPRTCFFRGYINPELADEDETRPSLDFIGSGTANYERFWLVQAGETRPGEAAASGKHIAVIVRWYEPSMSGFRRIVVYGFRHNPSLVMQ